MAGNEPDSGSDFDYREDEMFPEYLPVIDRRAAQDEMDAAFEAAQERLEQFDLDQQLREEQRRNALINRFEQTRQSDGFRYRLQVVSSSREVREYFARRHHFRYLKTMHGVRRNRSEGGANLGGGPTNGTVEKRRVVVKHGVIRRRMDHEIRWTRNLCRLEHVVNMVRLGDEYEREDGVRPGQEEDDEEDPNFTVLNETDSDEDPVGDEADPPSSFWESVRSHPWLRGEPIVIEDPPSPPPTPPVLPSAPTLVTEYMEMGDLHQFRKRLKAAGINPPTRFLWRVLLCLLRACTGLAYYNENPDPRGRENIPEGINPDDLAHGYLDLSHLLIGELQPDDDIDHKLVPLIKMCSFGETMDRPDMGMRENQLAIGRIIQTLAVPSSEAPDQQEDGLMPRGNARVPTSRGGRRISSYVHRDFWGAEHITFRFKAIVALLMARRNQDRRSLEDILLMVFEVNTESAEDNFNGYPVPADETDDGIAQFVRQYMFEASSNPPPLTTATLADGDDGDEDISRGPGPLSRITTWVGTGGSRGPDDLDPASFDIPDLPIGPLPPGSVRPDPDREILGAQLRFLRNNIVMLGQNHNRQRRRYGPDRPDPSRQVVEEDADALRSSVLLLVQDARDGGGGLGSTIYDGYLEDE
ncbi:hypothetical protein PG995_008157 [Apiospora arundinis]